MSMTYEAWIARANVLVLRALGLEWHDLKFDWRAAYDTGMHPGIAVHRAVGAFQAEIAAPLKINPMCISPRVTVETEDGRGVTIWEVAEEEWQMRPVQITPRDIPKLIDALQRATQYFTPAELGLNEAADAYARRIAEAQKTVGHLEGESLPDYMQRLTTELRKLRPAEDVAPDVG